MKNAEIPSIEYRRKLLKSSLFPKGLPRLWCPLLTHYDDSGAIDPVRISKHIRSIVHNTCTFLIPGSTGDGWEMDKTERGFLLKIVIGLAHELGFRILVGVLETGQDAARQSLIDTVNWLKQFYQTNDVGQCLDKSGICGFTVCSPKGKDLTQIEIESQLAAVLDLGLPTALYQLPQITENEVAPATIQALISRYPNLYLFKDTSGKDQVALAGLDLAGLYLVRGAEGGYAQWLKSGGGPYDGFLLSSANCFSSTLAEILVASDIDAADAGKRSDELSSLIGQIFTLCSVIPYGNVFANANKAIDHFLAYGRDAKNAVPPMLHCGQRIPAEILKQVGDILTSQNLVPERGYLADTAI